MRHFPLFQRQYSHYMHILCLTLLLVTIGIFMVYSASYVWASYMYGDPFYFVNRERFFLMCGFIGLFFATRLMCRVFPRWPGVFLVVSMMLSVVRRLLCSAVFCI